MILMKHKKLFLSMMKQQFRFQRLEEVLAVKPDVWIDFTVPEAAYPNTRFALEHGMAPVVGTTGFTEEQINELTNLSREKAIGGLRQILQLGQF